MSVYRKENPVFLRKSLNSVFSQTLPANEIVLVEDGPLTDELYEVIDEFRESQSTLKIVSLEQNHCSFEIIARMDTDDICYPDRFEKQISYMECHFDVDVVGCWTQEFYEDLEGHKVITSLKKFPNTVWHNIKYCTKRCPVEHPAVVLRKKAVLAVGGYQHCYLFEDYHLWARMFVNGSKFYNLQEPLLFFRISNESFKRRGGYRYAMSRIGFLSKKDFLFAVITRFPVRLLPNGIRKVFYNLFLRG